MIHEYRRYRMCYCQVISKICAHLRWQLGAPKYPTGQSEVNRGHVHI